MTGRWIFPLTRAARFHGHLSRRVTVTSPGAFIGSGERSSGRGDRRSPRLPRTGRPRCASRCVGVQWSGHRPCRSRPLCGTAPRHASGGTYPRCAHSAGRSGSLHTNIRSAANYCFASLSIRYRRALSGAFTPAPMVTATAALGRQPSSPPVRSRQSTAESRQPRQSLVMVERVCSAGIGRKTGPRVDAVVPSGARIAHGLVH